MKILEFIKQDPTRWTKGAFAKDKNGKSVSEESEDAVCFCLHGMILRFYKPEERQPVFNRIHALLKRLGYDAIVHYNDIPHRTSHEIIELLEEVGI